MNLYGLRDNFDPEYSHVIPAIIKKFVDAKRKGGEEDRRLGDGRGLPGVLYVEDATEGILLATERYNKPDPINLGSGEEIQIRDLVYLIKELVGFEGEVEWDSSKPDGQPCRRLDVSKAKKEFDFEAQISLKDGLKLTIKWYKQNWDSLVKS